MIQTSDRFKAAVLLNKKKAYEIAHEAGIHPSTLSKLMHGIEKVRPNDERIVRVGRVVGLSPKQCFAIGEGGGH
jgi:hypothetical protein